MLADFLSRFWFCLRFKFLELVYEPGSEGIETRRKWKCWIQGIVVP